ncbi:MAG: hypothetical protein K2V38_09730 [Gemmataceae bacterium]|nr:hypothetical protein [Gemmataceae bacterium]
MSDAHGWGLRIERLNRGPWLVGETYQNADVKITLINKANEPRRCPPLELAIRSTELQAALRYPDGRGVRCHREPDGPTRPEDWVEVGTGKSLSTALYLKTLGYRQFMEAGKYTARMKFRTPQGEVTSMPWVIEVVEPAKDDILASFTVPLDAQEAKRKPEDRERAVVEQIKIGKQVFLVCRVFGRGAGGRQAVFRCERLAELPGKVEMKVTGEYGRGKQLEIEYDHKDGPKGKRLATVDF